MLNAVVRWNTTYLDDALARLQAQGYPVHDEGVVRLAPFGFTHLDVHGRYTFTPFTPLGPGRLRPLRDPDAGGDEEDDEERAAEERRGASEFRVFRKEMVSGHPGGGRRLPGRMAPQPPSPPRPARWTGQGAPAEPDGEDAAPAGRARGLDRPPVGLRHPLGDGQPQPGAAAWPWPPASRSGSRARAASAR